MHKVNEEEQEEPQVQSAMKEHLFQWRAQVNPWLMPPMWFISLIINLCAVSIVAAIKNNYEHLHLINGDGNKMDTDKEKLYGLDEERSETKRPNLKAKVNGYEGNFLYDTSWTCIKLDILNKMSPHGHLRKLLSWITADL